MKVLFICKDRITDSGYTVSSGLLNSARMVAEALRGANGGVGATAISVHDNNRIDCALTVFRPTHAVIEALWVTPAKMAELSRLHPDVQLIVRAHSKTPFLSNEGIAIEWIKALRDLYYGARSGKTIRSNVHVAANSQSLAHDLQHALDMPTLYLPNIYVGAAHFVPASHKGRGHGPGHYLHIGCFGAIRPLKNQLIQAVAAIQYANRSGRTLAFHINVSRNEMHGQEVLKNLRALFAGSRHRLVEHDWLDHEAFLHLVRGMDIGMQVSYSESFNIVAADFVSQGIPIVVSSDIEWMPRFGTANPNSSHAIARKLGHVERLPRGLVQQWDWRALQRHNRAALAAWLECLEEKI